MVAHAGHKSASGWDLVSDINKQNHCWLLLVSRNWTEILCDQAYLQSWQINWILSVSELTFLSLILEELIITALCTVSSLIESLLLTVSFEKNLLYVT